MNWWSKKKTFLIQLFSCQNPSVKLQKRMNEVVVFLLSLTHNFLSLSSTHTHTHTHTHTFSHYTLSLSFFCSLSKKCLPVYYKVAVAVKWCIGSPENSLRANLTRAQEIFFLTFILTTIFSLVLNITMKQYFYTFWIMLKKLYVVWNII